MGRNGDDNSIPCKTDSTSDETAYRRYVDGEERAADFLVEKYSDALTFYINGYIRDMHEAEDLMIEAFAQIFAKERPIRGDGGFKAYLYKTARHLALRHNHRRHFPFLGLEDLDFEPSDQALTDTALLRDERNRHLYAALGKINTRYREALYLVYFEGLSYRGAGAIMGKTEQQVTNLIHRGKQSLKIILEQEGFSYADQ